MKATYTATTPCRVMVIHRPFCDLPHPKTPAFRTLHDIITVIMTGTTDVAEGS